MLSAAGCEQPPTFTPSFLLVSALKGLQIRDDVADLTRIEPKLRHCRMAGDDPLCERFLEVFNGIVLVERAEATGHRFRVRWDPADVHAIECKERRGIIASSAAGIRYCQD